MAYVDAVCRYDSADIGKKTGLVDGEHRNLDGIGVVGIFGDDPLYINKAVFINREGLQVMTVFCMD